MIAVKWFGPLALPHDRRSPAAAMTTPMVYVRGADGALPPACKPPSCVKCRGHQSRIVFQSPRENPHRFCIHYRTGRWKFIPPSHLRGAGASLRNSRRSSTRLPRTPSQFAPQSRMEWRNVHTANANPGGIISGNRSAISPKGGVCCTSYGIGAASPLRWQFGTCPAESRTLSYKGRCG